jgi:hypothetical protein
LNPLEWPALVKILSTFALIVILSRRFHMYKCLLAGSVLVGLWMGMGPVDMLKVCIREFTGGATLSLALVIGLIITLSQLLSKSGQLDRIVMSFRRLSPGPRFTMAAMPALIGLLPMPGGALFSAPMVDVSAGGEGVDPELKLAVNFWYRHIWEFWWPLYPGIILGLSLFHIEAWKLIASLVPMTIGSLISGYIFILSRVDRDVGGSNPENGPAAGRFVFETLPILLAIVVFMGSNGAVAAIDFLYDMSIPTPKYIGLAVGLALAIILVVRRNGLERGMVKESLLNKTMFSIVMIVFMVMLFKGVLIQSHAIDQIREDLSLFGIPYIIVIALLPLIAGLVTGIAVGMVGASIPLVVALIPTGESLLPYAVLSMGFGLMGMLASPVHTCLLVSREYFSADFIGGYRYIWKPIVFGMVWTIGMFLIFKAMI